MAGIKTVRKGAPAKALVTPIPKPVSRGVVESGERARLLQQTRGIPVPKTSSDNGYSTGSSVGGAITVKGAAV